MKGWFGSGKSRVRRTSLDFHYDLRPSIWHRIAERSHLIVAGVGSFAMLGLAGTAIWLALPSDSTEQIVNRVEAAPRIATASAASVPAQQPEAPQSGEPVTEMKPPDGPKPTAAAAAVQIASSAPPPDSVSVPEPMQIEPLDPTDPRWISATAGHAPASATAAIRTEASQDASEPAPVASAYADDESADNAATAAIPTAKPVLDADQTDKAVEKPADEKKVASAGRQGRTARSVTMRAKPDDHGGVLGTVPGSAVVQVVSCASWCEIVYKGKRGFVYRKFLRNNGR